jgi:hypothetical protein
MSRRTCPIGITLKVNAVEVRGTWNRTTTHGETNQGLPELGLSKDKYPLQQTPKHYD